MAQVDGVEVVEQDLGLWHGLFQLVGQVLLLDLALDAVLGGLVGPVCEDVVLDQLLGDRAGPLREIEAVGDADEGGTEDAGDVDAPMAVEALVLDGDKGVLQILGDAVLVDRYAVGVCGHQGRDGVARIVIHEGRVALGADINGADVRRDLEDPAVGPVAGADADDSGACDHDDQQQEDEDLESGKPLLTAGPELVFSPDNIFSVKNHTVFSSLIYRIYAQAGFRAAHPYSSGCQHLPDEDRSAGRGAGLPHPAPGLQPSCRPIIIANLHFLINTQKTKPALRKSVRFVSWLCAVCV